MFKLGDYIVLKNSLSQSNITNGKFYQVQSVTVAGRPDRIGFYNDNGNMRDYQASNFLLKNKEYPDNIFQIGDTFIISEDFLEMVDDVSAIPYTVTEIHNDAVYFVDDIGDRRFISYKHISLNEYEEVEKAFTADMARETANNTTDDSLWRESYKLILKDIRAAAKKGRYTYTFNSNYEMHKGLIKALKDLGYRFKNTDLYSGSFGYTSLISWESKSLNSMTPKSPSSGAW